MAHSVTACSRRRFLGAAAAGSVATVAGPTIICASKVGSATVIGSGEHRYEVTHQYPQLPDRFSWQTTHNVAIDSAQNLYVIHEGDVRKKDHPAIFVFDPSGKYIQSFGSQFQGGGHGLEIRSESGEEFLYVTGYKSIKSLAKLTLTGEPIWKLRAPMESGVYREGEDQGDSFGFQRDRFLPTNFAFLPDGGFLVADGYGSYYIHRYDENAKWVSCFGGPGSGQGSFNTPHDACFDAEGNIFVAEYVPNLGRVTKLRKLS